MTPEEIRNSWDDDEPLPRYSGDSKVAAAYHGAASGATESDEQAGQVSQPAEDATGARVALVERIASAISRADNEALERTNFQQLGATYDEHARAVLPLVDAEVSAAVEASRAEDRAEIERLSDRVRGFEAMRWPEQAHRLQQQRNEARAEAERLKRNWEQECGNLEAAIARAESAEADRDRLRAERADHDLANGGCVPKPAYDDLAAGHHRVVEGLQAAVQKALGCEEDYGDLDFQTNPSYCAEHVAGHGDHVLWTDRGCPVAVAAADAALDALGLTEETCCEGAYRDREEFGKYSVYTCADSERTCRTRLVGPWTEAQS